MPTCNAQKVTDYGEVRGHHVCLRELGHEGNHRCGTTYLGERSCGTEWPQEKEIRAGIPVANRPQVRAFIMFPVLVSACMIAWIAVMPPAYIGQITAWRWLMGAAIFELIYFATYWVNAPSDRRRE